MSQLLSADLTNRGLVLDPRSKFALMLSIVFFNMGGVGSDIKAVVLVSKLLGLIPIVLLLTAKQWKRALAYGGAYAVLTLVSLELFTRFERRHQDHFNNLLYRSVTVHARAYHGGMFSFEYNCQRIYSSISSYAYPKSDHDTSVSDVPLFPYCHGGNGCYQLCYENA